MVENVKTVIPAHNLSTAKCCTSTHVDVRSCLGGSQALSIKSCPIETHCALCSYCMNLSYAQQLKAPYNPNEYVDYRCVLSIQTCMIILLVEALVYFAIAIFLDNVLPNESGVRRPPWCEILISNPNVILKTLDPGIHILSPE